MQVIKGVNSLTGSMSVGAMTIGNFDGVHIGHQALLSELVRWARQAEGPSVVMTFDPHPSALLRPQLKTCRLFSVEDQRAQLAACGVDYLVLEPFGRELADLEPDDFIENFIWQPFHPQAVVVGYDFAFGRGRSGHVDRLSRALRSHGSHLIQVPAKQLSGKVVSSSRVRSNLAQGNLHEVKAMLGRNYYLEGTVVEGARRGRQMDAPTVNLQLIEERPGLCRGVYATWAWVEGKRCPSVTNVGTNPTFDEADRAVTRIECHILNFSGDLYGKKLRIEFEEYIRPEVKFNTMDDLRIQIGKDIRTAAGILNVSLG